MDARHEAGHDGALQPSRPSTWLAALATLPRWGRDSFGHAGSLQPQADDADELEDGWLRDADARRDVASPLYPAPGLAELDRLVARTAGAGVRVDVTRYGRPRDLPASIDLSAYRIVQEALTNVVKHAQTSSCQVLIGYGDDELTIEVTDNGAGMPVPEMAGAGMTYRATGSHGWDAADPALHGAGPAGAPGGLGGPGGSGGPGGLSSLGGLSSPGGGHGIIGMRERVTLLGGEFSAGPLPGYGFQVSAHIPLPASST